MKRVVVRARQATQPGGMGLLESILELLKSLKTRALQMEVTIKLPVEQPLQKYFQLRDALPSFYHSTNICLPNPLLSLKLSWTDSGQIQYSRHFLPRGMGQDINRGGCYVYIPASTVYSVCFRFFNLFCIYRTGGELGKTK